jgi:hypothetical protein
MLLKQSLTPQLNICEINSIRFVGDNINAEKCERYIVAFLDETLNFIEHLKRKYFL